MTAVEALQDFVRTHAPGQCKLLSKGDDCTCLLCKIDFLAYKSSGCGCQLDEDGLRVVKWCMAHALEREAARKQGYEAGVDFTVLELDFVDGDLPQAVANELDRRRKIILETPLPPFEVNGTPVVGDLTRIERMMWDVLQFYGDWESYFAIGFLPDPPCGEFVTDFSEVGQYGQRPGKRAREVLNQVEAILAARDQPKEKDNAKTDGSTGSA